MGNIHKVETENKTYTLNFNSYAVMMLYRTYSVEQVKELSVNELNFMMVKWGLSENGRVEISDPDVFDFIDAIGGAASEMFLQTLLEWIVAALSVPEESKKKEEPAEV